MIETKALLVIDMQKGSFTPDTPRFDTKGTVNRINELATIFRNQRATVIHIQHDGTGSGAFEKNAKDWEILDEIVTNESDLFIDKYVNDIFYKSELQDKLEELNVKTLFITGCATDFCVSSTVQSALSKDYNITILEDGHTTGDRPFLSAQGVINHYNWVWKNMIPTEGKINVQNLEQVKNKIIV